MKDTLHVGLKHVGSLHVDIGLTVPHVSPHLTAFDDMPLVFATAYMVAFIEATCIEAIASYLEEGEHSVGTHIDVSHIAATPIGKIVTAQVELIKFQKRALTFKVSAHDEHGLIGEGVHKRAVILMDRFMTTVAEKREG